MSVSLVRMRSFLFFWSTVFQLRQSLMSCSYFATIGIRQTLDSLTDATVPENIRLSRPLDISTAVGEHALIDRIRDIAERNEVWRTYIGLGYHNCHVPHSIMRNMFENPGWWVYKRN